MNRNWDFPETQRIEIASNLTTIFNTSDKLCSSKDLDRELFNRNENNFFSEITNVAIVDDNPLKDINLDTITDFDLDVFCCEVEKYQTNPANLLSQSGETNPANLLSQSGKSQSVSSLFKDCKFKNCKFNMK